MRSTWFKAWLLAFGLLASMAAKAADIDLFAGNPTSVTAPNVLIVMDTGASFSASNSNFRCSISVPGPSGLDATVNTTSTVTTNLTPMDSTNGGVEQCALYSVFQSLATGTATINVGIMFLNNNQKTYDPVTNTYGSDCINAIGGCLAMKITPLNTSTAPNILAWIKRWTTSGNGNDNIKGPANRGDGETMQEAWAYLFGKTGISTRDYSQPSVALTADSCAAKNIIYLANNYNQQASPKDGTATAESNLLRLQGSTSVPLAQRASPAATTLEQTVMTGTLATGCGTNLGTLPTAENKGAYALNWALYMKDQGVTTYTVGVEETSGNGCDATYGAWLNKMGGIGNGVGEGGFFHTADFSTLVLDFKEIIGKINGGNSFALENLNVPLNNYKFYKASVGSVDGVLGIRPEHIAVGDDAKGMPFVVESEIEIVEPMGSDTVAWTRLAGQPVTFRCSSDIPLAPGQKVMIGFDPARGSLFDAASGLRV